MVRQILIATLWLGSIFSVGDACCQNEALAAVIANVIKVKKVLISDEWIVEGELYSTPKIDLLSAYSGRVAQLFFKTGDLVKKGDKLVTLDIPELGQKLQDLNKQLVANRAAQAKAKVTSSHGQMPALLTREQQLLAQRATLNKKIKLSQINAPFAGKLGLSQVNVGETVVKNQTIATLYTVDPLKVDFVIPERVYVQIKTGYPITVRSELLPETLFLGKIEALDAQVKQGEVKVRAVISNPQYRLMPGSKVTITIKTNERQIIKLPRGAIRQIGKKHFAYLIRHGTIEQINVVLGMEFADEIEVKRGLREGETVVLLGKPSNISDNRQEQQNQ